MLKNEGGRDDFTDSFADDSKATKTVGHANKRNGFIILATLTDQRKSGAIKQHGSGAAWFDHGICSLSSSSLSRAMKWRQIAMIPFDLAKWMRGGLLSAKRQIVVRISQNADS